MDRDLARAELENLIAKTAMGSRSDFKLLYMRTSAKLFGICLRVLNDKQEAEEALQEAYVKVWRSAGRYAAGNASPISWLAAVARNAAIDRYRKRKPEGEDIEEAMGMADDAPSPEFNAVLSDEVRRLNGCMGELDERHAFAVRNIYLSGWTYEEAAGELEVPVNTTKTWVRRSLIRLKECMGHE